MVLDAVREREEVLAETNFHLKAQRCLRVVVSSEPSPEGQVRSAHMKTEQEDPRKKRKA